VERRQDENRSRERSPKGSWQSPSKEGSSWSGYRQFGPTKLRRKARDEKPLTGGACVTSKKKVPKGRTDQRVEEWAKVGGQQFELNRGSSITHKKRRRKGDKAKVQGASRNSEVGRGKNSGPGGGDRPRQRVKTPRSFWVVKQGGRRGRAPRNSSRE